MPRSVTLDENDFVTVAMNRTVPDGSLVAVHPSEFTDPATQVICEFRWNLLTATRCWREIRADGLPYLTQRPDGPIPVLQDATTVFIEACPAGTKIRTFDLIGNELMGEHTATEAEDVTISLTDPGTYQIEVEAPAPFLESPVLRFEVTA